MNQLVAPTPPPHAGLKSLKHRLFAPLRRVALAALLLCTAWAAQAQNLTVKVNTTTKTGQASLQAAIEASNVQLADITSIEISAGTFNEADWTWLKSNKTTLGSLTKFNITNGITAVADIPGSTAAYFGAALETVDIAKVAKVGANAFYLCSNLKSISLPQATYIGYSAFNDCPALVDVELPEVEDIDEYAFAVCTSLTNLNLPKAKNIWYDAFTGCTSLSTVNLPAAIKIDELAFSACRALSSINLPKAQTIGCEAFSGCKALKTLSLPSATTIEYDAFYGCISLTYLQLPATPPAVSQAFTNLSSPRYLKFVDTEGNLLTGSALNTAITEYKAVNDGNANDELWWGWTINGTPRVLKVKLNGGDAIYEGGSLEEALAHSAGSITAIEVVEGDLLASDALYMRSLTSLEQLSITSQISKFNIPLEHPTLREFNAPHIDTIGANVFNACSSLTTVNLPKTLVVANRVFRGCTSLTSVNMPEVNQIGESAFYGCISLSAVDFPKVVQIGKSTFSSCEGLKNVSIPKLIRVPINAFYACSALETLHLPLVNYVEEVGFFNCISLKHINGPLVSHIGKEAFSGCISLTDVSFAGLKVIGNQSFINCSALVELHLGAAPPTVGSNAFKNCHSSRFLHFIDTDGNLLTGDALTVAYDAYKAAADGKITDELWWGWCFATSISIKVNNGNSITANSLETAIATSDISLNDVTRIDVVDGRVTAADWQFLKNQRTNLSRLSTFNIQNAVAVADIPATTADEPYFGQALERLFLKGICNIGASAFEGCTNLVQARLLNRAAIPAISIGDRAFAKCTSLSLLMLPSVPPLVVNNAFVGANATRRFLQFVNFDGQPLVGTLSNAQNAYRAVDDGDTSDDKWYGWNIVPELTISVNGGNAKTAGSFEMAIAACGVPLPDITSIEITRGYFTTTDWTYLKQQRDNLNKLMEFAIAESIDAVDNIPSTAQTLPYFGPNIEKVSVAKIYSVGSYAFEGCTNLNSVHLPNAKNINSYAFSKCTSLSYIGLPNVTTIELYAFQECDRLANISLPKLTELGAYVFFKCSSLTNIELGATPPSRAVTGNEVFKGCPKPRNLRIVDDSIKLTISMGTAPKLGVVKLVRKWGNIGLKAAKEFVDQIESNGSMVFTIPYSATSPDTVIAEFISAGALAERAWVASDKLSAAIAAYKSHQCWDAATELWYGWTLYLPTYTLTYTAGANGSISGQTTQTVQHGGSGSEVEAKPNNGYVFKKWSDGLTTAKRTDYNVQANLNVTAEFDLPIYTLSYTASEGGSISGQATQTVQHGGSGSEVEAVAQEGYRFVKWSDGRTTAKRTDYNVQGNLTVTAEFEKSNTTGLLDTKLDALSVYPNPTQGVLWVSVPELAEGTATEVHVYNANGQLLQRVPAHGASAGSAASRLSIDLSAYPAGMYIIRVGNAMAKVVKQ